jgi:hypothetical protein
LLGFGNTIPDLGMFWYYRNTKPEGSERQGVVSIPAAHKTTR